VNAIVRKIGRWLLIFALAIALLVFMPWSYVAGKVVAHVDVARGRPKLLVYGLEVSWRDRGAEILHDRYGLEVKRIAGCRISESLVSFARGYNAESEAAMRARTGRDVVEESFDEARVAWERAHPQSDQ